MNLTLLIPGLLWPREILRETTFDLPLPALARLLGRAHIRALAGEDAWLAETFGIDLPLPAAALRLLGDGGKPGHDDWICLDPVHLRLHEWAVMPDHPDMLALSAGEDAALRDAVAPLFADLGELMASSPGHWMLHLAQAADIETRPLADSVGRAVEPMLPGGAQGAEWRRRLAEAQPLLHAHEVNRERVKAGRPTVNHLWPWGAGRLPSNARRAFDRVLTEDLVLRGLATLAGCETGPVPERHAQPPGRTLIKLDRLSSAAADLDAMAWRQALAQLEADWFAPALRGVVPPRLTLVATGHDRAIEASLSPLDALRVWKRPRALADLAP